jgi:streptomycin 6-kinase
MASFQPLLTREGFLDHVAADPNLAPWLEALDERVNGLVREWGLEIGSFIPGGLGSYVVSAKIAGREAVLKLPFAVSEINREFVILRAWGKVARGYVPEIIAYDPTSGALLLERVIPGNHLGEQLTYNDLEQVVRALDACHKASVEDLFELEKVVSLKEWMKDHYAWNPTRGRGDLWEKARVIGNDLLASSQALCLLHGDINVRNILRGDGKMVIIDPRGRIGDREFDFAALAVKASPNNPRLLLEPLVRISECDKRRLYEWAVVWSLWYGALLETRHPDLKDVSEIDSLVLFAEEELEK